MGPQHKLLRWYAEDTGEQMSFWTVSIPSTFFFFFFRTKISKLRQLEIIAYLGEMSSYVGNFPSSLISSYWAQVDVIGWIVWRTLSDKVVECLCCISKVFIQKTQYGLTGNMNLDWCVLECTGQVFWWCPLRETWTKVGTFDNERQVLTKKESLVDIGQCFDGKFMYTLPSWQDCWMIVHQVDHKMLLRGHIGEPYEVEESWQVYETNKHKYISTKKHVFPRPAGKFT